MGWICGDQINRSQLFLINSKTHLFSLQGNFKVWFPDCNIVEVLLDFKEIERFSSLIERLRSLRDLHEVNRLIDFLNSGYFPILMIMEKI